MRLQDTRKWKKRLKYLAGIFVLAATVVLALTLPDLYSRWQDAKTMGEVVLSQREGIQFLDTDALDISARLKMLGESSGFYHTQGMVYFSQEYSSGSRSVMNELVGKCRDSLKKWQECNLIPSEVVEAAELEGEVMAAYYYVQIDAGMIPVAVLCFVRDPYLEVIMDADNGFLYYVGCSGIAVESYMMQCMGLGSDILDEVEEEEVFAEYSFDQVQDFSRYRFAELAGAESQEIESEDATGLFLNVKLLYDDFTSMVYRTMFTHDSISDFMDGSGESDTGGTGLAVMFGNWYWIDMAVEVVNWYYGTYDEISSVYNWIYEWNDTVLSYGRDDLLMEESEAADASYSEKSDVYIDGHMIAGKTESAENYDALP